MARQKKRRPHRSYTDEEKAHAVAAVAANGGNVNATARQLDIPAKSIENWIKQQRSPHVANLGELKKPALIDKLKAIALKLVGIADEKANGLNAKDAMIAAGIAIDKARLCEGEPTVINEQRGSLTHRIDHLASAFASAADREETGGVLRDGTGEPVDPRRDQSGDHPSAG